MWYFFMVNIKYRFSFKATIYAMQIQEALFLYSKSVFVRGLEPVTIRTVLFRRIYSFYRLD